MLLPGCLYFVVGCCMLNTCQFSQPNLQSKPQKEGNEFEQFWSLLGGKCEYRSQKITKDTESDLHLYVICNREEGRMLAAPCSTINIFREPNGLTLVDTGNGAYTLKILREHDEIFEAEGIDLTKITRVIFTHAHIFKIG